MKFTIAKGLDVPIGGLPAQEIDTEAKRVSSVALLAADYSGVRPTVLAEVGQRVRLGQALVRDRLRPRVQLASPGSGVVREILRGPGGALQSIVVELQGEEEDSAQPTAREALPRLERDAAIERLLASGLWAVLRTRPFGHVPDPDGAPRSIFVTAIDTDPLAARPDVAMAGCEQDFGDGLAVLALLTDGPVFVCQQAGAALPIGDGVRVTPAEFEGPHPAGLVGTHIHRLDPVGRGRTCWHIGYPDVVAIGRTFTTGRPSVERVVALAGPQVTRPRLVRTRLGASVADLTAGELAPGECRVVSGSVLSGRQATSWGRHLGRFHRQVCALEEPSREPGRGPVLHALRRRILRASAAADTTARHGRPAAMVPTGAFERVVPLDLLTTPLLRALLVGDLERAEALGCLELDEEDLALCTYVCPSKIEYGAYLRSALERLQVAG